MSINYNYCFTCGCERKFINDKCIICGYKLNIYDKLKWVIK